MTRGLMEATIESISKFTILVFDVFARLST